MLDELDGFLVEAEDDDGTAKPAHKRAAAVLVGVVRKDEVLLVAVADRLLIDDKLVLCFGGVVKIDEDDAGCKMDLDEVEAVDEDGLIGAHSYGLDGSVLGLSAAKSQPHFSDFC